MPNIKNPRTGKSESFAYPSGSPTSAEKNEPASLKKAGALNARTTSYTPDSKLPKSEQGTGSKKNQ
tara:strand:+ start:2533 stop:2730 length:198 start_codon:yes stop_codon:yes gene_type:complete